MMHLFVGRVVFPAVPTPAEFDEHLVLAGILKTDSRGWVATRHSLRHTFNTMLYAAGVDSEGRQHLGGWATGSMPEGQYLDARALGLREAVNRLPRMWG